VSGVVETETLSVRAGSVAAAGLAGLTLVVAVEAGVDLLRSLPLRFVAATVTAALPSALAVVVAAVVGAALAPVVGLRSRLVRRVTGGDRPEPAPFGPVAARAALAGGLAGAVVLAASLPGAVGGRSARPLTLLTGLFRRTVRVGVVDTVVYQWGGLAALAWVGWLATGRPERLPRPVVAVAVAGGAVASGVVGLSSGDVATLSATDLALTVAYAAVPGTAAGWVCWRDGLEAAVVAGVVANAVLFVAFLV
jgi:hypothetical protein